MSRELCRAERVLEYVFRGWHHVEVRRVKRESPTQITYTHHGDLSTFDWDQLTRLVVAAHSLAVRVEVSSAGPCYVRIRLSERTRNGDMTMRHPTLAEHLTMLNPPTWEADRATE